MSANATTWSADLRASPWRSAVSFARIGFLNMLAYRARYYVGVLTYLFNVSVYYFIWRAVYQPPTVSWG